MQGLTDEFFAQYKKVFEEVREKITGFGADSNSKNLYTQNLLNRLLFIAFVQKKGWLNL